MGPGTTQPYCYFLSYTKRVVNVGKEHERTATLRIAEVHLRAYFHYTAGFLMGADANSKNPAIQPTSFFTDPAFFKDVAHILHIADIYTKILYDFRRKLIIDLEEPGLKIVALISIKCKDI